MEQQKRSMDLDKPLDEFIKKGGDNGNSNNSNSNSPTPKDLTNRLYVTHLDYKTSWQDLKDHFRKAGDVVYANIFKDEKNRSKGCGIVEFATKEEAAKAIQTLNRTKIGEDSQFEIFIREDREDRNRDDNSERNNRNKRDESKNIFNKPRKERSFKSSSAKQGRQVFVSNLPYSSSWQDLKDTFKKCGQIERADILKNYDGRSKGQGIVLFVSSSSASNALEVDGTEIDGRKISVKLDEFPK